MHDTPNAMQHSVSTLQVDADEVPPAAADSSPLLDPETESSNNPTPDSNEVHRRTGENQTIAWLLMTIPLILHFLSIVVLTVAIKFYISGHSFNLDSRRALTTFAPLQSDITTAISSGISILRIFTTMWTTSTAWRCAFILMENGGISLEQINRLLTWQIHFNSNPISSRKAQAGALISVILLAAFPCQLSGPILTGSITWTPSHGFLGGKPIDIATSFIIPDWSKYNFSNPMHHLQQGHSRSSIATYRKDMVTAAYLALMAWPWQDSSQDGERTMKRVTSRVAHLPIDSTLSNVTLPYFAVTKLEWITDPWTELPEKLIQSVRSTSLFNPFYNADWQFDSDGAHGQLVHTFALIPDADWDMATPPPTPFTGTVTETRILAGVYSQSTEGPPCSAQSPFGKIPQGIGLANLTVAKDLPGCYIFARVTYVAGASRCTNCRVSSWITIQNDSSLTVSPDLTTVDALDMMPLVALQMVAVGSISVPKAYNNLDGYAIGLLTRSYGAAWTFLMDNYIDGQTGGVKAGVTVRIAVPTSKANVLWWRVLLWLMLNMMFTLSGLLFLFLQSLCRQPVVVNPSIAALLLDTSDVLHKKNRALCNFSRLVKDDEGIGYLELRQEYGGHRRVVVVEE